MIEPDKASLLSPDDQATVRHRADRDRCEHGAISALPLKADIASLPGYVRFVPLADSCTAAKAGPNAAISLNGSYGISGLMFAARITFPHFSVSEAISLP
jgi:hypothetical protein